MSRMLLAIGVLALAAAVAAQVRQDQPPLGTVAKATKEERAKAAAKAKSESKTPAKSDGTAKTTTEVKSDTTTKKYTNADLYARPKLSVPTSAQASYSTRGKVASNSGSADRGADEAYWRRRAEPLRRQLQHNTERLNVAKARLERKKAPDGLDVSVANGRYSPTQAERNQLASYVMELEAQVRRDEQALKALEDEGRRAGALPGWFR